MEENKENEMDWDSMFQHLLKFSRSEGPNIPKTHVVHNPDGSKVALGSWVNDIRKQFAIGALAEDHKNKLQELVDQGIFRWQPLYVPSDKKTWDEIMAVIYQHIQEKGTANVPYDHIHEFPDGHRFRIGRWLTTQRRKRKRIIR